MNEASDASQRLDMLISPDAHVTRGNPTAALDGRGFDHDQCYAACGSTPQVNQMPVVSQALLCAVLAHRRHHDPVAKGGVADGQPAEQIDFWDFPIMIRAGGTALSDQRRTMLI